jgi:hypothetical protein
MKYVLYSQSVWFQSLFCQVVSMMEYVIAVMVQMSGLKSVSPSDWRVCISTQTFDSLRYTSALVVSYHENYGTNIIFV